MMRVLRSTSRRDAILHASGAALLAAFPMSIHAETLMSPSDVQRNKAAIATFIDVVWRHGRIGELATFWTADCVNHADPSSTNNGLGPLRHYHEHFGQAFAAFQSPEIDILQQIAEGDRVVTQMVTRATHAATGRSVSLATIRIDRLENGKIAEHWSIADMAGLMQQLNG